MNKIENIVKNIKRKTLTNNTQKVALKLLKANGKWIARNQLEQIPSAAARIRDLRKKQFGQFEVECKSANSLNRRNAQRGMFYYRIEPDSVTETKLKNIFKIG